MTKEGMPEHVVYSPDEQIEAKFGRDFLEAAAGVSKSIFTEIKLRLVDIGNSEGSSSQQREKAKEVLAMWREFANNLLARTSSDNLRSPEMVDTAIKGASALMSPEPTREGNVAAKALTERLQKRYGK